MPKHSPHHGLPVPPTPLWWEQRWVTTSCKLFLLIFRAEMGAWSLLKEWCHSFMGEELVPGDLQREIVTGSPRSDGDFGACVPLSACALLTWGFRHCQELAGSPAQSWGGWWNPAPLLWDLRSDRRTQPCPILPQWIRTLQSAAFPLVPLSYKTSGEDWNDSEMLSQLWGQLLGLSRAG